ncbi:MAG: hypothetical protein HY726_13780, partial [Candidatus Rokubacteria bacterium]|nr:hypothetical protein [Candidatus Rokubacteria bacterium]
MKRLAGWQQLMLLGFVLWVVLSVNERGQWLAGPGYDRWAMVVQLLAGVTILQGAC